MLLLLLLPFRAIASEALKLTALLVLTAVLLLLAAVAAMLVQVRRRSSPRKASC
jgi:hypothetical protein